MKRALLVVAVVSCGKNPTEQESSGGGNIAGDGIVLDPTQFSFGGRKYTVRPWEERFESGYYVAAEEDSRKLVGRRNDARQLAPCPKPRIMTVDANGDGSRDLVFYTCGYVHIYADHTQKLHLADPVISERKEKHWVSLDTAKYPGIAKIEPLIHQIDPDVE